jgi:hypothetical protein
VAPRQFPEGAIVALGGARHEVMIGPPVHAGIVNPPPPVVAAGPVSGLWETLRLMSN